MLAFFIPEKVTVNNLEKEARLKEGRPCTHPDPYQWLWNRLLWNSSPDGPTLGHSFSRHELAVSPFAWQGNKAVFSTLAENSLSEMQFSTGAQRPSFLHRHQGWVRSSKLFSLKEDSAPTNLYLHALWSLFSGLCTGWHCQSLLPGRVQGRLHGGGYIWH